MMTVGRYLAVLLLGFLIGVIPGGAEPLVELARPGPWAGVSGLVAYGSRLYLVNSQISVNHNSADLYSYQPGDGALRFERRLFSQDAGTPAIVDGLLYWPFEDPRFSTTRGEFSITNGTDWQWRVAPEIRGFHVHAMLPHRGVLYALGSGWRGRIYASTDRGQHWMLRYEHPTPERRVSRITAMVAHGETLYFALTSWAQEGVKLLRQEGAAIVPTPGWPPGGAIGALAVFQGMVYAVHRVGDTHRLWRSDGHDEAQPVAALDGYTVQALAAAEKTLWAVSDAPQGGGFLWRSADGVTWHQVQPFPALPIALTVVNGQVFVGSYDTKRGGALWGPATPQPFATGAPPPMPSRPVRRFTPEALARAVAALDKALAEATHPNYRQHVLAHTLPLALSYDPAAGQALSRRLQQALPSTPVSLIGGQVRVPAARLAHWYLLHAIAVNGHGYIPPALITTPWTASPNRAEKYLEPSVAAAWAVAKLAQADPATLAALDAALAGELPGWARGDFLAARYVLTGRPFRYGPRATKTPGSP